MKTRPNKRSVKKFLSSIKNEKRKEDAFALLEIFESVTKEKPVMWGDSIVGFGTYTYKYASGREGDWPVTAFSPRAQFSTVYIMTGFEEDKETMKNLGKYKTGKSCLYIKKLEDVSIPQLKKLIKNSVKKMKKQYE